MSRILLVSILLTVVYSWEEFKRALFVFFKGFLLRRDTGRYFAAHVDQFVSMAVIFVTVPLGLSYLLLSGIQSDTTYLYAGFALVLVSVVAFLAGTWARFSLLGKSLSLTSVFYPKLASFAEAGGLPRLAFVKFATLLSLPAFIGFLTRHFSTAVLPKTELLPSIDLLVAVLIVALFARICIDVLERHFRSHRLKKVFGYYRIVLGIILAAILLAGQA